MILEALRLIRNPEQYLFLSGSGCTQVEGVDDRENFLITRVNINLSFYHLFTSRVCLSVLSFLQLGKLQLPVLLYTGLIGWCKKWANKWCRNDMSYPSLKFWKLGSALRLKMIWGAIEQLDHHCGEMLLRYYAAKSTGVLCRLSILDWRFLCIVTFDFITHWSISYVCCLSVSLASDGRHWVQSRRNNFRFPVSCGCFETWQRSVSTSQQCWWHWRMSTD